MSEMSGDSFPYLGLSGLGLSGSLKSESLQGAVVRPDQGRSVNRQAQGHWGRKISPLLVLASLLLGSGCSEMRVILSGVQALRGGSSSTGSTGSSEAFYRASQTISGQLDETARVNPLDDSYIQDHPLTVQSGDILIAAMNSADFDTYLAVRDSSDQIIASDDDSGPDVNSFMAVRFPSAGSYTIEASSFEGGETGDYELGYTLGSVEWEQTIASRLGEGSARHPSDESWMEEHALEARGGRALLVSMTSTEIDAYLEVLDAQGEVIASNDDSGGDTDALLVVYLPESGTYTIRANTFSAGETGSYTLQYRLL
ncbi:MAG: hypothetical protein HC924_01225 [Synechococcaceae cyanobacterium SM2_3_2]|nr:hypothetical protein [Synechococcaceae cyanobacterium SM2_3_2]